jgi:D-alanyl-D-alanine carboxypeptidase
VLIKNIFILIFALIIVVGSAASFLFFQANSAQLNFQTDNILAKSFSENEGMVLAAMDKIGLMPKETYASFYPENNLPPNQVKIVVPKNNPDRDDLLVNASSSMAIDRDSDTILWQDGADTQRPIGSITKLMTALVFLDTNPDWEKIYELKKDDVRTGGKSYIYPGDQMKVKDLFYLTLVGSDNTAAVALVKSAGLSEEKFVDKMNEQAKSFGLAQTSFADISGLSQNNVSTARELVILAKKCLAREKIRETSIQEKYDFSTSGGREVKVRSTDLLLSVFPQDGINIIGGKTGHIEESGYCFVGEFINAAGNKVLSVVLGAASDEDRFAETKKLVRWSYDSYSWQ